MSGFREADGLVSVDLNNTSVFCFCCQNKRLDLFCSLTVSRETKFVCEPHIGKVDRCTQGNVQLAPSDGLEDCALIMARCWFRCTILPAPNHNNDQLPRVRCICVLLHDKNMTSQWQVGLAALSLGMIFVGTCNEEVGSVLVQRLMESSDTELEQPMARLLSLGLGLLFIGKNEQADAMMEVRAARVAGHVAMWRLISFCSPFIAPPVAFFLCLFLISSACRGCQCFFVVSWRGCRQVSDAYPTVMCGWRFRVELTIVSRAGMSRVCSKMVESLASHILSVFVATAALMRCLLLVHASARKRLSTSGMLSCEPQEFSVCRVLRCVRQPSCLLLIVGSARQPSASSNIPVVGAASIHAVV